jgi:ectoine hydroxylase-related dioxygenase (phytanoyl-CoA dioxygenase family)
MGGPFKLSTMLARTLEPGTPAQPLHADVRRNADGWPLVGFIVMVDDFHADNGATRFVPGSHLWAHEPHGLKDEAGEAGDKVLACGPVGSVIMFNGSVWHRHTANRSTRRRRSVQGAFISRGGPFGDRSGLAHAARDV